MSCDWYSICVVAWPWQHAIDRNWNLIFQNEKSLISESAEQNLSSSVSFCRFYFVELSADKDGTLDNGLLEGLGFLFSVILIIYSKVSLLKVKQSFPCKKWKILKEIGIKPHPFCNWPHPIKYQVLSGSSHSILYFTTVTKYIFWFIF